MNKLSNGTSYPFIWLWEKLLEEDKVEQEEEKEKNVKEIINVFTKTLSFKLE